MKTNRHTDTNKFLQDKDADARVYKRSNRFNGESVMLTKQEASKHDAIFMCELMATLEDKTLGTGASKHWATMRKHLDWFIKNNAKAYQVLLD
jgi:hypothetical protein